MARLQTFPDDVQITGSLADAQRQLGNAVPSLLAEVLAREIAKQLLQANGPADLKLKIAQAIDAPPAPPTPQPVLAGYLGLKGEHAAHPGTGLGARALTRKLVAAE